MQQRTRKMLKIITHMVRARARARARVRARARARSRARARAKAIKSDAIAGIQLISGVFEHSVLHIQVIYGLYSP